MKLEIDPAWVEKKVRAITNLRGTEAVEAEADLYCRLLLSISAGQCQSPANCAAVALRTQKMSFHQPKEN